jgi:hypothetical protein
VILSNSRLNSEGLNNQQNWEFALHGYLNSEYFKH